jgi:hypothetical protein
VGRSEHADVEAGIEPHFAAGHNQTTRSGRIITDTRNAAARHNFRWTYQSQWTPQPRSTGANDAGTHGANDAAAHHTHDTRANRWRNDARP